MDEFFTLDVDFAFKVRVVEELHGDLCLSLVLCLEFGILDVHVLFDVLSGEDSIVANSEVESTHQEPVADRRRESSDEEEEDIARLEGEVGDEAGEEVGHDEDESRELQVAEGPVPFDGQGRVRDRSSVRDFQSDCRVERRSPV